MRIRVGTEWLAPGERRQAIVPVGHRPDGTILGLPVMGLMGREPGPVLGITAGVHGDEYEGAEAVRLLMAELNPDQLKGAIICTPQANYPAYESLNRVNAQDYQDLNRSFPGREDGYLTQRFANLIVKEIVEQANFHLDLHSVGIPLDIDPYSSYLEVDGEVGRLSFEMAKVFGIRNICRSVPFNNVIRLEALKRGIPALLAEAGGEARCRPERVQVMLQGVKNILSWLGMIEAPVQNLPESYYLVNTAPSGSFVHSPEGGFFRPAVVVGQHVTEGDVVGSIVDVFGKLQTQVTAPQDGIVVMLRTMPAIRVGDWVVSVMKIDQVIDFQTSYAAIRQ